MPQRARNQISNVSPSEITSPNSLVKIPLNLAAQGTGRVFQIPTPSGSSKAPPHFSLLPFESEQHFARQRVYESKGNEIRCPFAFDVRKIASRMNARTAWIPRLIGESQASQREFDSLQIEVRLLLFQDRK